MTCRGPFWPNVFCDSVTQSIVSFHSRMKTAVLPCATTYLWQDKSRWVAEIVMLSSANIWSRLVGRVISFIQSFSKVVGVFLLCGAYPTLTLLLVSHKCNESQGSSLKMSVKFKTNPNQALLKFECFAEAARQCPSRTSAEVWQGTFRSYLPCWFPVMSFNQASLLLPPPGSPGLRRAYTFRRACC